MTGESAIGVDPAEAEAPLSVQPTWCLRLPLQQQSVLLLAARGPDGVAKRHPCKNIVRAYRATVLVAGTRRRTLHWGEAADSFMGLDRFADAHFWAEDVKAFFDTVDELPHHYLMHLAHGAQITGFHHPDIRFRERWAGFYVDVCDEAHMIPESKQVMDERLNDVFGPEREACACVCHRWRDRLGMSHATPCCDTPGRPL